ncbi:MAG: phosphate acetyltransferase [Firmicutes bacterium]|nr:phosphate acetyltransferase [Bacillota bacterium]
MTFIQSIHKKAKEMKKHIVLPEGEESRTVEAASIITKEGIAKVTLIGDPNVIKADYKDFSLKNINIVDPKKIDAKYAAKLLEIRQAKGMTDQESKVLAQNPLFLGALMVKMGEADGMVAGAINSTGDVLRPALQIIKTAKGINTVSSCFIMLLKEGSPFGDDGILIFGDCAVIPNPTAEQLKDIAISSADTARSIGLDPRVAMLSFSTKGSAKHELTDKVIQAFELVKTAVPNLLIDGELQADAALVKKIGASKAPSSLVAGCANVLIFPDLQAGNIGYKLVERLAGAQAIGPICQGFSLPVNDLSRGCSVDDIVNTVAMTVLQSGKGR